jgi:hypothetical protein
MLNRQASLTSVLLQQTESGSFMACFDSVKMYFNLFSVSTLQYSRWLTAAGVFEVGTKHAHLDATDPLLLHILQKMHTQAADLLLCCDVSISYATTYFPQNTTICSRGEILRPSQPTIRSTNYSLNVLNQCGTFYKYICIDGHRLQTKTYPQKGTTIVRFSQALKLLGISRKVTLRDLDRPCYVIFTPKDKSLSKMVFLTARGVLYRGGHEGSTSCTPLVMELLRQLDDNHNDLLTVCDELFPANIWLRNQIGSLSTNAHIVAETQKAPPPDNDEVQFRHDSEGRYILHHGVAYSIVPLTLRKRSTVTRKLRRQAFNSTDHNIRLKLSSLKRQTRDFVRSYFGVSSRNLVLYNRATLLQNVNHLPAGM